MVESGSAAPVAAMLRTVEIGIEGHDLRGRPRRAFGSSATSTRSTGPCSRPIWSRTPSTTAAPRPALRRSFAASQHAAIAWDEDLVVGTARLLSDGVCNAYLVDVWTRSSHRRRGVATAMVRDLMARVPGQHVALQTDDAEAFYESLGFSPTA